YKWDKNIPSSDKLKRVADYLGVTMEYLINDGVETKSNDDACAESIQSNDAYAESIRSNPDLMLLLSAASELKREDIALVVQLIERIKRQ
ncbi:MAG: hypothetical protein Q4C53_08670, partial [Clostridia bacterium]|nr:hypothetical protein [Clostridia bacterium]